MSSVGSRRGKGISNHPYLMIFLFTLIWGFISFGAWWFVDFPATVGLIGINVIVFILIKAKKCHAMNLGMLNAYVEQDREYYRIVTSAFTHQDPIHILCNLGSLYNIGSVLEPVLGTFMFVIIYVIILIAGGILSCLVHRKISRNAICIGASGTICGLLGVYIALAFGFSGLSGIVSVLPSVGLLLLMTFSRKIDSVGHFSGLAVGLVCGVAAFMILK